MQICPKVFFIFKKKAFREGENAGRPRPSIYSCTRLPRLPKQPAPSHLGRPFKRRNGLNQSRYFRSGFGTWIKKWQCWQHFYPLSRRIRCLEILPRSGSDLVPRFYISMSVYKWVRSCSLSSPPLLFLLPHDVEVGRSSGKDKASLARLIHWNVITPQGTKITKDTFWGSPYQPFVKSNEFIL